MQPRTECSRPGATSHTPHRICFSNDAMALTACLWTSAVQSSLQCIFLSHSYHGPDSFPTLLIADRESAQNLTGSTVRGTGSCNQVPCNRFFEFDWSLLLHFPAECVFRLIMRVEGRHTDCQHGEVLDTHVVDSGTEIPLRPLSWDALQRDCRRPTRIVEVCAWCGLRPIISWCPGVPASERRFFQVQQVCLTLTTTNQNDPMGWFERTPNSPIFVESAVPRLIEHHQTWCSPRHHGRNCRLRNATLSTETTCWIGFEFPGILKDQSISMENLVVILSDQLMVKIRWQVGLPSQ